MSKIDSGFAILDVKKGRAKLRKRVEGLGRDARIPVLIRGFITGVHSKDDGISQEFSIDVESAEEIPDTSDIPEAGEEWFKKAHLVLPKESADGDR